MHEQAKCEEARTRLVVRRFLDAVESRDLEAIGACFAPDATYRNVPHDPVVGPQGVRSMFAAIVARSARIEWEIVSEAYAGRRAHLERIDRFWIDGRVYVAPCHGVVVVDTGTDPALIMEFRDYLDLGAWRAMLSGVL